MTGLDALSEHQRDFLEKTPSAAMITVSADGVAKPARIGLNVVDGRLWSSGTQGRVRTRRLRRDPRCTLYVHDAGEYKPGGEWRRLEPGMTLTVEPGCYIRPADDVPRRFWNTGVRIEDDVVVTPSGCEVLTAAAPKSVRDIETLVGRA